CSSSRMLLPVMCARTVTGPRFSGETVSVMLCWPSAERASAMTGVVTWGSSPALGAGLGAGAGDPAGAVTMLVATTAGAGTAISAAGAGVAGANGACVGASPPGRTVEVVSEEGANAGGHVAPETDAVEDAAGVADD